MNIQNFEQDFKKVFPKKRLLAVKLDGFSHSIWFDNGKRYSEVEQLWFSGYAPESPHNTPTSKLLLANIHIIATKAIHIVTYGLLPTTDKENILMKANFETRKHISNENYDKITRLRNNYGEVQFRMTISHLIAKGFEYFAEITKEQIDESYEAMLKDEANKMSVMTPEFCRDLNYCALELSKLDHILLLKYITNYVFYDIK